MKHISSKNHYQIEFGGSAGFLCISYCEGNPFPMIQSLRSGITKQQTIQQKRLPHSRKPLV